MKRKVKRYYEGGVLSDRYGNPVRSSSGETVKTRYGSSTPKEDRPTSSGAEDYESLGKRAGATSTMSGPKEYISESIKEDTEKESPRGIASGFSAEKYIEESGPRGGGSGVRSTTGPAKKKVVSKPKYSGVVGADEMGNQDFSSKAKPAMDVSSPGGRMVEKNVRSFKGFNAPENSAYVSKKTGVSVTDDEAYKSMKEKNKANLLRAVENKSKSATSLKSPGSKMDMNDPYSMSLGSDLDPKSTMRKNARLSGDMDYKKGGAIKKMASGGKTSSASSRGDGIAMRGKTKGRIC